MTMNNLMPVKDELGQRPIPIAWRHTLREIVECMRSGDFAFEQSIPNVLQLSSRDAERIQGNIDRYGVRLDSLPEAAWETSVCQWMQGYWDVLIDLYTIEEGCSDLTLSIRVSEAGDSFTFEVLSVHVP
jgi:hypothetical protein